MATPLLDDIETEDIQKYNLKVMDNIYLEILTVTNYIEWLAALTDCCTMEDAGWVIDTAHPPTHPHDEFISGKIYGRCQNCYSYIYQGSTKG